MSGTILGREKSAILPLLLTSKSMAATLPYAYDKASGNTEVRVNMIGCNENSKEGLERLKRGRR